MDDAIEALLEKVPVYRGRSVVATALTGGLTNRIYRVDAGGEAHVLRVLSPGTERLGIDRDHEHASTLGAARLGIGPEVIHYSRADGILVVRLAPGRTLSAADAREPRMLPRIASVLRRLHDGPAVPGSFSPFAVVRDYRRLALENGVGLPGELGTAMAVMDRIEAALAGRRSSKPCHNDLLAANFLDDGERIWLIDWEYGGMGDPFFDLGNFAVNQELDDAGRELLLASYLDEVDDAGRAHLALMALASDLREGMWGFLQSGISDLDEDYVAYGTKHVERFLARAGVPELDSWLEVVARGSKH